MTKVLLNVVVHSRGFSNSVLSLKSLLKSSSHDLPWTGLKIPCLGNKITESPRSACTAVLCEEGQSTRNGVDELEIWVKWNIMYQSK